MSEPKWLTSEMIVAIHEAQLIEHGGGSGLRDLGMLESALERPRNKWTYENVDLASLAAAYGYAMAKNHPFIDGNKRTALMAIFTFLGLNDIDFDVLEAEFATIILALAAGEVSEESLGRWIRDNLPAG
ncbi:MAG TPA: type II toxin-antitoxin system death-on-curing family toxin [Beijerinckiaceae bacterium]|nr:type II toxin-antitoxin system death-on-curing family toxin [Beijerinckiaceae bacterium]